MTREEMIAVISAEIQRLEHVRHLLEKSQGERFVLGQSLPSADARQKRVMSPEGRRRIGLAQKRRWAKHTSQSTPEPDAN